MDRITSQFSNLKAWINTPPRVLIVGNDKQSEDFAECIAASGLLNDSMIEAFPPTEWGGYGASLLPLRNVRNVMLVKSIEDDQPLLQWRHARVWEWLRKFGRGDRHRVRWAIHCSEDDRAEACEMTLTGGGEGAATFGHFSGYVVRSFRGDDGGDEIRAVFSLIEPTDLVTWDALKRTDKARNALMALHAVLQDERSDLIPTVLRMVNAVFEEQRYEIDRFCRPNCHQHGGQWRKWLASASEQAKTENVTHILQSGRALLPLLQL